MYIPRDPDFLAERAQYALRYCCEDCVFYRPAEQPNQGSSERAQSLPRPATACTVGPTPSTCRPTTMARPICSFLQRV